MFWYIIGYSVLHPGLITYQATLDKLLYPPSSQFFIYQMGKIVVPTLRPIMKIKLHNVKFLEQCLAYNKDSVRTAIILLRYNSHIVSYSNYLLQLVQGYCYSHPIGPKVFILMATLPQPKPLKQHIVYCNLSSTRLYMMLRFFYLLSHPRWPAHSPLLLQKQCLEPQGLFSAHSPEFFLL